MPQFVFSKPTRLVAGGGGHIKLVRANTPVELPERFIQAALIAGGTRVDGAVQEVDSVATDTPPDGPADRIRLIAHAMRAIQDTGDKTKLTAAGKVRTKEIESAVGFDTTLEEREAAEALLEDD